MLFLWFYNKFWGEKKRDSEISIFRVKKEHKIQKSDIISLQTKNTKDFKLMLEFQFIKLAFTAVTFSSLYLYVLPISLDAFAPIP